MARPLLVVIQGAPGVGKTTLIKQLEKELHLPTIGKDDIKELLFDRLAQSDREYSRLQGKASFEMLYAFARTFLENGNSVVIEGAFHTEISRKNIQTILHDTNAKAIELFCHVDEATRIKRFTSRSQDGTRHPSHLDSHVINTAPPNNYLQLNIGKCIDIDTTEPYTQEKVARIVEEMKEELDDS